MDETLNIIVKLQDEASSQMQAMASQMSEVADKVGSSLSSMGGKISSFGSSMSSMGDSMKNTGMSMSIGLTAPIVALGTAIVETSTKFQSAMELIRTQAGASQKEVDDMTKSVLALAKSGETGQGPQALAEGLYHVESLGYRGAAALDILKTSADAADTGMAHMEDVTTALGAAMVTGIKGTEDAHTAMGLLNATIGAGNMKMQDLTAALGTGILPAAKNFGLTLTDVGAALATLTDNGMGADEAATRLRMTFSLMAAPSKKATEALGSIGISQLQLADDMRSGGLIKAIEDLNTHLNSTQPASEVLVKSTKMSATQIADLNQKITDAKEKLRILNEEHVKSATVVDAHGKAVKGAAENVVAHTVAVDKHNLAIKTLTEQINGYQAKLSGANTVLTTTGGKMLDASQKAQLLSEAFGGGRSSAAILTLTEQVDRLGSKYKQVTDGANDFAAAVEATHETNQFKLNAAMAQMSTLMIDLGGTVVPIVVDVMKELASVTQKVADWWDKLSPGTQSFIAKAIMLLAVLGPVLVIFGSIFGAIGTIIEVVGGAITAVGGLTTAFAAMDIALGPILLIIAALVLLGLAIYEVYKHWGAIKDFMVSTWNTVSNYVVNIMGHIRATIVAIWGGIKDYFAGIWNGIKSVFTFGLDLLVGIVAGIFALMGIDIRQVFDNIAKYFTAKWTEIKNGFTTALQAISTAWQSMWNAIRVFLSTLWEQIKGDIQAGWDWIVSKFEYYITPVTNAWSTLWKGLTTGVTIAWDFVKNTIKDAINWIIEKINAVINAINTVAQKGASVLGLGAHAPQIPTIPLLAEGGIVNRATLAVVGEAGPEAVIPLSKMGSMGIGGGGGIVVTINNPQVRNNQDLIEMRKMVEQVFRPLLLNAKTAHI